MLLAFTFHSCTLLVLYHRKKGACLGENSGPNTAIDLKKIDHRNLPFVTVQLPIYNEYYVVDRLLKSITNLKWPQNKLEIQILDDSDDATKTKLQKLSQQYHKKGFIISYLHRKDRIAYKAGALKAGLSKAQGEFIAIFDADFTPPSDFLLKTMPYFKKKDIGMVQTRWGHLNANSSFLTRAQAIGINGHFVLEQSARNANQLWINFNGTAGVWRRTCIIAAGNWQGDTLTEDLDLSYRAALSGWNFRYILDTVCPAEIPATISAFKGQQSRWCTGSLQTALKLSKRIWQSKFNWKIRTEAILRLFRYSVHPLMLLNIILCLPLMILIKNHQIYQNYDFQIYELPWHAILAIGAVFLILSILPITFYIYAQREIDPKWLSKILWFPAVMMIGCGISINNSYAYFGAFLTKKSVFIRTPKFALRDNKVLRKKNKLYQSKLLDTSLFLEFAMGLYCLYSLYYSYISGHFLLSTLLSIYTGGFFYLSFKGLQEKWQQLRC